MRLLFILICIAVFFAAILPVTANLAFVLMGCGLGDSAFPVALVIAAILLILAIVGKQRPEMGGPGSRNRPAPFSGMRVSFTLPTASILPDKTGRTGLPGLPLRLGRRGLKVVFAFVVATRIPIFRWHKRQAEQGLKAQGWE